VAAAHVHRDGDALLSSPRLVLLGGQPVAALPRASAAVTTSPAHSSKLRPSLLDAQVPRRTLHGLADGGGVVLVQV
jgi:hypothetical protein